MSIAMRISFTRILSTVCLVWPLHSSALAQPQVVKPAATPDPLVTAVADIARPFKRQAQRDPLVRSSLTLPEPQLTLQTTKGKGRATGTVGLVQQTTSGERTLGLVISSPIGDAPDAEARPLDLRGLSNGATIAFSVGSSSLFKVFDADDVRKVCDDKKIAKVDCTAGKLEDVDPATSQALLDIAFRSVPLLYGASFTYGRNSFNFYNATGARQDPVRHSDIQAEGSLGLLVSGRRDLLAFHLGYSDVFTPSSNKTQLCRPLPGTTASRCDMVTIGEPNEERSLIGTIEYRWQKRGNTKLPFAFAPKFQFSVGFDDTDDVTSFEAPFYIFQEKPTSAIAAPKLNGGVSAGWRSDSGFEAAVFVGTTFSLFKM
jgi:hypothetical protein